MPHYAVEKRLAEVWPPRHWHDLTVLVAVSGGADSVALLRALAAIRLKGPSRLVVAHYHHGLRGAEADADQQFVENLAQSLGLACETGRGDVAQAANQTGDGLEAAARTARYEFLCQTAERLGARYVATAHTADDQAETMLHHIVRGTGLSGLAGMPRVRLLSPAVTLIRPLLTFRRDALVGYLGDLGQPYRNDTSNHDTRLTRNRLRHELLPALAQQYNTGIVEALLRLGSLAAEAQEVIDGIVDSLAQQCAQPASNGSVTIDCHQLGEHPPFVVRETLMHLWRQQGWPLQDMGHAKWDELAGLVASDPSTGDFQQQMLPGAVTARRDGRMLRLSASSTSV